MKGNPYTQLMARIPTCDSIHKDLLTHDDRLGQLMGWLGRLSTDVRALAGDNPSRPERADHIARLQNNIRFHISNIAAFTFLWFCPNDRRFKHGIRLIATERERQKTLLKADQISFDCASPIVDNRRKFRALVEEVGEVAEAIDDLEQALRRHDAAVAANHLNEELTQVAAVCVAWLEALEAQP